MHDELARYRYVGHEENGGPWVRHWDTGSENEQAAAVHRSQASALRVEYEQACGDRPLAEVSVSPLERYGIGGSLAANSVVFHLDAGAGPADHLLAELKCHRAWMMLAPEDSADDPLDLPGIVLDAKGDVDGITVSLAVRDPELVAELHRRAARVLETHPPQHEQ